MAPNNTKLGTDNVNKRDLFRRQRKTRKEKFEDESPTTEEESPLTLEAPGAGAPMEGVSQSAGLTGGSQTDTSLENGAKPETPKAGTPKEKPQEKQPTQETPGQNKDQTPNSEADARRELEQAKRNRQAEKTESPNQQSGEKEKQKRGIKDTLNNRLDRTIDRNLEKSDKKPTAQRYRDLKQNLKNQKDKQKLKNFKEAQKQKIKQAVTKPARAGTGHLLKLAWLNLIDSFGLTYLYIVFHFVMAYFMPVLSNLFCKFGEEWVPQSIAKAGGEEAEKAMKSMSKPLELLEILGCFLIGVIIAVIIGIAIVILMAMGWIAYEVVNLVKEVFTGDIRPVWEVIKLVAEAIWKE